MVYKLKTAPTSEPLTLAEAKLNLKLDSDTTDDNLITALIVAAREAVENFTNRALINQTWETILESFDDSGEGIELNPGPLSSITSIVYKDADGASQTASASTLYEADLYSMPGKARLKYGQSWPGTQSVKNAVTITYVSGYGSAAANVPGPIKQAMHMLIAHLYENRESVEIGQTPIVLPHGVEFLLSPYRIIKFK